MVLHRFSMKQLVYTAAGIGVFTVVSSSTMYHFMQRKSRASPYYLKAVEILRAHPKAIEMLGEPMKVGVLNLRDPSANVIEETACDITIPVRGPKGRALLLAEGVKSPGSPWEITRLDLQFENSNKSFTIFEKPRLE